MLNNDKLLNTLLAVLLILGVSCIGYVLYKNFNRTQVLKTLNNLGCVKETYTVDKLDQPMKGTLAKGQHIVVYTKYFECNPVERDQMVFFNIAEGLEPVIRFIRGIPGDKYAIEEITGRKGDWSIKINGKQLLIADGTPFFMKSETVPPLRTYQISRSDTLGKDEYIILSRNPPGLTDSTNLGLVAKSRFIGRAEIR